MDVLEELSFESRPEFEVWFTFCALEIFIVTFLTPGLQHRSCASVPPAQKLCFNLEHEMDGSELLDVLSDVGPAAQFADVSSEEEQAFDRSESFNWSEPELESEFAPEHSDFDSTSQSDEQKSAF